MSNIFMQIPNLKGTASASDYKEWIAISSIHFGVNRELKTQPGKVANREGHTPHLSEVEVSKRLDSASNGLFKLACTGKAISQIEIHICMTGDKLTPYAKYILSDVVITKHDHAAVVEAMPVETLRLNYTKMEISYLGRDAKGNPQSPDRVGYNLATAEMS